MSLRQIQRTRHVGWRTVREALDSAWPKPRAAYPQRASRLDAFKPVIDDILVSDLDAPRKQRHTARRILDRLIDEHDATGVSYGIVRDYVAQRRPQIRVENGRGPAEAFVPQTHLPGREAEVDFGEVAVRLGSELVTCYLLCLRMSYSGKAGAPHLRLSRAGGVLRGPHPRLPSPRWGPRGKGPLRQPQGSRRPSARVLARADRGGPVDCVSIPLRPRGLLLPARYQGRSREGRRGGAGRLVPSQPP